MNINELVLKIKRRIIFYKWQFLCFIKPDQMYSFTLIDGSRFDYPLKSAVGCSLFINNFETTEIEFVRQSLQPGNVFLDVGANAGAYTIIAAKEVGTTGHVYAFEPGVRELSLLRHNIAINNLTNVTVIEKAVSNYKGTTKFAISQDGAMNSLAETNHPQQKIAEWQTVEIISLDDFVEDFGVQKLDFIKIDVEGAEHLVFEGAKNLLLNTKKINILFEASDLNASGFGYSVKDFIQKIINSGLSVYYFDKKGNIKDVLTNQPNLGKNIYNFVAKKN
jgi:FkbM family methyltransferase